MTTVSSGQRGLLNALRGVLSSPLFPFVTAALMLCNWYVGIDVINIAAFAVITSLMFFLLDDMTPLLSQFLFINIIVSIENSPMYGISEYYYTPLHLAVFSVAAALLIVSMAYRFVRTFKAGRVKLTPTFASMIALCAVFMLNGAFSSEYVLSDFLYGLVMLAALLPAYMLIAFNVKLDSAAFVRVGYAFAVFSLALIVELVTAYVRMGASADMTVDQIRLKLVLGWGTWNALGMLLAISIPPVLYLAVRSRFGAVFLVYSVIIGVAVLLTTSRQAYLGLAIVLPAGYVATLVKGRRRPSFIIVTVILLAGAAVFAGLYYREIYEKLKDVILNHMFDDDGITGNGRDKFFPLAWENFKNNPVFGAGFFPENLRDDYYRADGFAIPCMCHNTIAQIISCCGAVGIAVYAVHRAVTVVCALRSRSFGKMMVALSLLAYLSICMFDNHLFNISSTFVYSALLPFATNAAEKEEREPAVPHVNASRGQARYNRGDDAFLDSLTDGERAEFFALFIDGTAGCRVGTADYVTGGKNRRFFSDACVNAGSYLNIISPGLMSRIYEKASVSGVKKR